MRVSAAVNSVYDVTHRVGAAREHERGGDAAGDREAVRVVVRVQPIERAQPRLDQALSRVRVRCAGKRRRGVDAQVRVQIYDPAGKSVDICVNEKGCAPWRDPCPLGVDLDEVGFRVVRRVDVFSNVLRVSLVNRASLRESDSP